MPCALLDPITAPFPSTWRRLCFGPDRTGPGFHLVNAKVRDSIHLSHLC